MTAFIFIALIATAFLAILASKDKKDRKGQDTPIKARSVLTMNEQPTFLKLREAMPDCFILAQVAHSALLTTTGRLTRNKFNRTRADFVVMNAKFKVLAVIELDDASHKGNEEKDRLRDTMLKEAGYTVLRYKRTPEIQQIRRDLGISAGADPKPLDAQKQEPSFLAMN